VTGNQVGQAASSHEETLAKWCGRTLEVEMSNLSAKEVKDFSDHCVYIRSVFRFALRIFRNSDADEQKLLEEVAPLFFEDLAQVFTEYAVLSVCRITDPAKDPRGNDNFTVELFVNNFAAGTEQFKKLDAIYQRMKPFRTKIVTARNKLAAHADRAAVSGPALGTASWEEWDKFWTDLADFVRTLNEITTGKPFEIDAGGVQGDGDMLFKALRQSQHFETLLNGNDTAVTEACLTVALAAAGTR
jgi:hypothetical protein